MNDQDWYGDSDPEGVVERSERVTRAGWAAIAGVSGLVGAVTAAVVVVLGVVLVAFFGGMVYVVMTVTR
ncbi:hypothetical protein [Streptomyces sp. NPDC056600]|uniref:hypothetical protein n=1 Tax=Streptomyces sp. NPDC056600 TaxID=3345874 RepID=UPI0036A8DBF4